jgi:hypothetical protein
METSISARVVKEESHDPEFILKISYNDGVTCFSGETVRVLRKPPRVRIEYPGNIKKFLNKIKRAEMELEIMRAIVEYLLNR